MKQKLEDLWKKYEEKISESARCIENNQTRERVELLKDVLSHKWMYSKVEDCKILITGINPSSDEKNDKKENPPDFFKLKTCPNPYYKSLIEMVGELITVTDYLDLFTFRKTAQSTISTFLNDPIGLDFIAEHLAITQHIIEQLNPYIIIVANKGSWKFWGKIADKDKNGEFYNIWMGYKYEPVDDELFSVNFSNKSRNYEICKISGLKDEKEGGNQRVSKDITETNLVGTIVVFTYMSGYLDRKQVSPDERVTSQMIKELYEMAKHNKR
ncbi:MAG: hypothetical protein A2X18_07245 [Bacteroidetes bacterium GWF2_40_14]|nr:MAG: hypothetical protein A2X18_07245 [Bacteroidetes bacterium GWF2_40_14]